jgi:hypothetical protein
MAAATTRRGLLQIFATGVATAAAGVLLPRGVLAQTPRPSPAATPRPGGSSGGTTQPTATGRHGATATATPEAGAIQLPPRCPSRSNSECAPGEICLDVGGGPFCFPPYLCLAPKIINNAVCCSSGMIGCGQGDGSFCCPAGMICTYEPRHGCSGGELCGGGVCAAGERCASTPQLGCCTSERACVTKILDGNDELVTCCPEGTRCIDNQNITCCPTAKICGSACCSDGTTCVDGQCCPAGQICHTTCCASGSGCSNDGCCPSEKICYDNCCNGHCVPPGSLLSPSGRSCFTDSEFAACVACSTSYGACRSLPVPAGGDACDALYQDCLAAITGDFDYVDTQTFCLQP